MTSPDQRLRQIAEILDTVNKRRPLAALLDDSEPIKSVSLKDEICLSELEEIRRLAEPPPKDDTREMWDRFNKENHVG